MQVLHVINSLGAGGAERSLAELLPELRDRGIDSRIACFHHRDAGVHDEVVAAGFEVHVLSAGTPLRVVPELRRLIRERQPDLVHTTIFDGDVAGRLAAARTGVPVLSSIVNMTYDPDRVPDPSIPAYKLRAVRAVDAWTARHLTSHFHAITHAVKASAVRALRVDADRVTVVERGRDGARLGAPSAERRAAARAELGLRPDAEVLVNVGRQEFQKGQADLLRALPLLRARERLVLLIAGREGNASGDLRALAEASGVGPRVRFLGHRDDVVDVLAAGDVFVFPSKYEGLGGAVLEAMALGLPVVASRLPPLEEVVEEGESADLVPVGDPAALGAAIEALLDDTDRRERYGRRARRIFEERFTLGRSAERMAQLYEAVAR